MLITYTNRCVTSFKSFFSKHVPRVAAEQLGCYHGGVIFPCGRILCLTLIPFIYLIVVDHERKENTVHA